MRLDSNSTNIIKDIFNIPTEDIQKITTGHKKVQKTSSNLENKRFRISIPDKVTKFMKKNYKKIIKQNITGSVLHPIPPG